MSAIAGIIKFDNSEVPQGKKKIIKEVSSIFCTDRTDEIERQGLYFMCGHQYVTREAEKDRSPIINKNEDIVFNADIFLFNRPELIEKLTKEAGLDYRALTEKGDAELAYLTYQKYGIDFVNILNGAYAIVIYDKKLSKVFLITDHLAFRHLAYTVTGKELYYSSTYHVISALMEESLELDEEWMSAAYMDFTPDTEKLHGRSPYKNVFRIEPAHYIEISMSKDGTEKNISVENNEYWNPQKTIKPLKLSSDEEYGELFRKTFIKSVKSMLRARDKYGILLSGGLDSSAVASIAADELSKSGDKLYSYTQVPCSDYKKEKPDYLDIEDETQKVLKNKEKYPNIECCFVPSRDLTVYSEPEKYIYRYAQPVKPILNAPYYYALEEEIKKDGISIVLNGGAGNSTISYGNIATYVCIKNSRFHYLSSIKEATAFCERHHVNRPALLKYYISNRIKSFGMPEFDTYLKEELKERYHLKKIYKKRLKTMGGYPCDTNKRWKSFINDALLKQHISYYDTCKGLFTGTIFLDPTTTKEMVELCVSFPIDCFVKNGRGRRAVRDYMKGIVSDEILDNESRGLQAADFLFRANKYWDQTKEVLFDNLNAKELDAYVDRKKIDKLIEDLKSKAYNIDKKTIAAASVASVLGCFLKNYERFCKEEKWKEQVK